MADDTTGLDSISTSAAADDTTDGAAEPSDFSLCSRTEALRLGNRGFMMDAAPTFVGDFNADGLDDFYLGQIDAPNEPVATHYVMYGGQVPATEVLEDALPSLKGVSVRGEFSWIRPGGDIDNDGAADLLVSEDDQCFVVYGRPDPSGLVLDFETGIALPDVLRLYGDWPDDLCGLHPLEDVDGDEIPDTILIVGDREESSATIVPGKLLVASASAEELDVSAAIADGDAEPLLRSRAASGLWWFDRYAGGLGDVDGDGYDDFYVRALEYGRHAMIVFGRPDLGGIDVSTLAADGNGFLISADEFWPELISSPGDVDEDGRSDVLIAETYPFPGPPGRIYLVYGRAEAEDVWLDGPDQSPSVVALDGVLDYASFGTSAALVPGARGAAPALLLGAPAGYEDSPGEVFRLDDPVGTFQPPPNPIAIAPALTGRLGDDSFGTVVSVGKFYGSSASDLIVSAPRDNSCAEHGGRISLYAGFVGD